MRTVKRRSRARPVDSSDGSANLSIGEVTVDRDRHEVTIGGRMERLPLKEFDLLRTLMANAGRVVSRGDLIDKVWGADYVGDTKTLDSHIRRLRRKIEVEPSDPQHIVTVRGVGYKYSEPVASPAGKGDH